MLPLLAEPLDVGRGRNTSRHPSLRAARHCSQEALTPPVSPPLSPTSVLPPSPRSKRNEARSAMLLPGAGGPSSALLQLCEPPMLLLPVSSPSRPSGFEASPTLPLPSSGPVHCTPSLVRCRRADASGAVGLQCLAPLFGERQAAILPTLAGVTISEVGGALSLHKTRVTARPKGTPVARAAEILVCRSLGIVKDGEDVTAAALDAFADRFKEQLSPEVLTTMAYSSSTTLMLLLWKRRS
ncbi:hypothetical protein VPH35_110326 [Triticum aestivum]